jgi:hypothetical protein
VNAPSNPRVASRGRLLVFCALLAGFLLGFSFYIRWVSSSRTDNRICVKIHRLDIALQGLVAASVSPASLGKIAYYRAHPDELAAVIAQGKRQLQVLRAADCDPGQPSRG